MSTSAEPSHKHCSLRGERLDLFFFKIGLSWGSTLVHDHVLLGYTTFCMYHLCERLDLHEI